MCLLNNENEISDVVDISERGIDEKNKM